MSVPPRGSNPRDWRAPLPPPEEWDAAGEAQDPHLDEVGLPGSPERIWWGLYPGHYNNPQPARVPSLMIPRGEGRRPPPPILARLRHTPNLQLSPAPSPVDLTEDLLVSDSDTASASQEIVTEPTEHEQPELMQDALNALVQDLRLTPPDILQQAVDRALLTPDIALELENLPFVPQNGEALIPELLDRIISPLQEPPPAPPPRPRPPFVVPSSEEDSEPEPDNNDNREPRNGNDQTDAHSDEEQEEPSGGNIRREAPDETFKAAPPDEVLCGMYIVVHCILCAQLHVII